MVKKEPNNKIKKEVKDKEKKTITNENKKSKSTDDKVKEIPDKKIKEETSNKIKKEETLAEKQKRANRDVFLDYAPYLIIILVVIIIRSYIATPIRVNGTSMDSTLYNGETMILNKLAMHLSGIKRWDIVVIKTPESYLIKRVIALPGEKIKYEDGKLYINNQIVEDKYSLSETADFEEIIVNTNEYFVMGDNRAVSQDSRVIGAVSKKDIKGKTNLILFPLKRFGIVD